MESDDQIFGNLNGPSYPTLPADPFNAPGYSFPQKFLSYLNQRFVQPAWSAATLPGDVLTGKTSMADPQAQARAMSGAAQVALGPAAGAPESALATGWAPSAWRYFKLAAQKYPELAQSIDRFANGWTPNQLAAGGQFANPTLNAIKDQALQAHADDLSAVRGATWGDRGARETLERLRGQTQPAPPDPLASRIAPASQPWPTFRLKEPDMPPFPANDPRPIGTTLNSPPPGGYI